MVNLSGDCDVDILNANIGIDHCFKYYLNTWGFAMAKTGPK